MKHKKPVFIIFSLLLTGLCATLLFSQDRVDEIHNQTMNKQHKIITENLEHQKRILARFNQFAKMVDNIDSSFKIKIPMHPGHAKNIRKNNHVQNDKPEPKRFAYLSEPYRLRSKPSDRDKNYIARLNRGSRVQVVYTVSNKRSSGEITTQWCFVKQQSNTEGFVPLNILSTYRPRAVIIGPKLHLVFDGDNSGLSSMTSPFYAQHETAFVKAGYMVPDMHMLFAQYANKRKVTARPYLTIRGEDSASSMALGRVYYGEIVDVTQYGRQQTIDGISARWAKINYSGAIGWVFGGYLEKIPLKRTANDQQELASGQSRYVKSENVRLREQPGDDKVVTVSIPHQEEVYIKEVKNAIVKIGSISSKWVKVSFEGYIGWVFGGYLAANKTSYIESDSVIEKKKRHTQFVWPVKGYRRISSPYGWRRIFGRRSFHHGIDIVAPLGAPIVATQDGQCILRHINYGRTGYGCYIVLDHGGGKRSLYGHMSRVTASQGKMYRAGQTIGLVGSTGSSTGPHLHFEVRVENKPINPMNYVHP